MRFQTIAMIIGLVLISTAVGGGLAYVLEGGNAAFPSTSFASPAPVGAAEEATQIATASTTGAATAATVPAPTNATAPTELAAPQAPTTAPLLPTLPQAATPPTSTLGASDPVALLLLAGEREAALRSGALVAELAYGDGARSEAQVQFDLGDVSRPPRFHITSVYSGTTGTTTVERITIGAQSWQREQNGPWVAGPAQESVLKQLQAFLPRTNALADPSAVQSRGDGLLQWYDSSRDAAVLLRLAADGTPLELRRESELNDLIYLVSYNDWNGAVEIAAPNLP